MLQGANGEISLDFRENPEYFKILSVDVALISPARSCRTTLDQEAAEQVE